MEKNVDSEQEAFENFKTKQRILLTKLKHTKMAFISIFAIFIIYFVISLMVSDPVYTANATIGPPNPSPATTMLSSGSSGSLGGLARKVMGAGSGTTNDPFQEYQNLLQSPRLVDALIKDDHILQIVFEKQWDAGCHCWKQPGMLHGVINGIKRALNRPVHDHPDANQLYLFLQKNLMASQSGSRFALSTMSSGYIDASLNFKGREKSMLILSLILNRADDIVRQGQLDDVKARIKYLQKELLGVQNAEQREALINVLSSQEQLKAMLIADKRFATTIISPPYADEKPTSPVSPGRAVMISFLLSLLFWIALTYFEDKSKFARKALNFLSFHKFPKK